MKFRFTVIDITADGGSPEVAVAVTLGLPTSRGPFPLIVADVPGIGTGAYPNVLPAAFVIPSSILLHTLSLRQLHRRSRVAAARRIT